MTISINLIYVVAVLAVYFGMGVLIVPVAYRRIHQMFSHNTGWTWKTTLFGNKFRFWPWFGGLLTAIALWPIVVKDIRPR